ncbi:DUF192 domain-containing protein [Acidocella sp. KAb 2-4]|uniref:DUF192 domain-containing protein n=1 Tax=Acidocella sp. KAb 2-4 TaxID=2885158 RepID=UPI001D078079|nr:DUF192 domain-containing protein [Acidocella sp. KAb 2-4]MCB5943919.1 DUF192 domain-containing protein [Acidocella sp. KAb 2-4]
MRIFAPVLAASLLLGGAAMAQVNDDPTGPQPQLPTEKLSIQADNGKTYDFTVEVAATPQEQAYGLMFRPAVPAGTGMLFPVDPPSVQEFWMKNTIVPLDMVFIGADGTVKTIAENTVPYSLRNISSNVPVAAVLELAGGATAADDINVGDKVIAKQFGGG